MIQSNNINKVPITAVCDFQGGSQPPKKVWVDTLLEGYVRMLQIRDFTQPGRNKIEYVPNKSNLKKCNKEDILIGRYGASVGKICTGLSGAYNVALMKVVPDESRLLNRYLFYILKSKRFYHFVNNVGSRAAQAGFNKKDIEGFQIPLPPLPIQRRIAAILDQADALRRKDQELLELYDALAQSVFLDMFGDPVRNEKGFNKGRIADLVEEVKYGTSKKASSKGEYPYLRMNNLTYKGEMDFSSLKYIDLEDKEKPKYLIKNGDLLFNRTNSKELVGKTAVYRGQTPMVIAGYLLRVRTKGENCPEYISGYLNSPYGKLVLENMCKNIVGMANINAKEFQTIKILTPPIDLQKKYQKIIFNISSQKRIIREQQQQSEALFQSLLQKAFKGELVGAGLIIK